MRWHPSRNRMYPTVDYSYGIVRYQVFSVRTYSTVSILHFSTRTTFSRPATLDSLSHDSNLLCFRDSFFCSALHIFSSRTHYKTGSLASNKRHENALKATSTLHSGTILVRTVTPTWAATRGGRRSPAAQMTTKHHINGIFTNKKRWCLGYLYQRIDSW